MSGGVLRRPTQGLRSVPGSTPRAYPDPSIGGAVRRYPYAAAGVRCPIPAYLANGGALEHAQEMAAHESPRTTKLYDRTKERLTRDEMERDQAVRPEQPRQLGLRRGWLFPAAFPGSRSEVTDFRVFRR